MDFNINEEAVELAEQIKRFIVNDINPLLINNTEAFPQQAWYACCEFGLTGIPFDASFGGLGVSPVSAVLLVETMGQYCNDNGFIFALTNHVFAAGISVYLFGRPSIKKKYTEELISGQAIGAYAITEEISGSDAFNMKTTYKKTGSEYVLNGSKTFITNGPIASTFIVFAKADDGNKISAFILDKNNNKITVGMPLKKIGLTNAPMSEVKMKDCVVAEDCLLGKEGDGKLIFNHVIQWERCYNMAACLGVMKKNLELSIKRVTDKKLGNHQSVSNRIADMKIAIELSELSLYKTAWLLENKKSCYLESAIAKYYTSQNYIQGCLSLLDIHGAYGYIEETKIGSEINDALASCIYSGTNDVLKNIIARYCNI